MSVAPAETGAAEMANAAAATTAQQRRNLAVLTHPVVEMLNAAAVAAALSISVRHLWRLMDQGKGPPCVKLGGATRFPKDQLLDWIAAGCPARGRR